MSLAPQTNNLHTKAMPQRSREQKKKDICNHIDTIGALPFSDAVRKLWRSIPSSEKNRKIRGNTLPIIIAVLGDVSNPG
jgi:hypothetical protein